MIVVKILIQPVAPGISAVKNSIIYVSASLRSDKRIISEFEKPRAGRGGGVSYLKRQNGLTV
jgi:hypothetical protein